MKRTFEVTVLGVMPVDIYNAAAYGPDGVYLVNTASVQCVVLIDSGTVNLVYTNSNFVKTHFAQSGSVVSSCETTVEPAYSINDMLKMVAVSRQPDLALPLVGSNS